MVDPGKAFEDKFKQDWKKSMPDSDITRIYDTMNGFKHISNISDFICYSYPNIYYMEVKAHKGASIPFEAMSQIEKLKTKVGIKGVRAGFVVWLYEKDIVFYVPVATVNEIEKVGESSVGIRHFEDYRIIQIPSTKKRVFMDSDYSVLKDLKDGD